MEKHFPEIYIHVLHRVNIHQQAKLQTKKKKQDYQQVHPLSYHRRDRNMRHIETIKNAHFDHHENRAWFENLLAEVVLCIFATQRKLKCLQDAEQAIQKEG